MVYIVCGTAYILSVPRKTSEVVSIRLPSALAETVRVEAERRGITVSRLVMLTLAEDFREPWRAPINNRIF